MTSPHPKPIRGYGWSNDFGSYTDKDGIVWSAEGAIMNGVAIWPPPEQRKPETIQVGDVDDDHVVGDPNCPICWSGYPTLCQNEGCDGLVHASFGDEDYDCNYWLVTLCDACGESE